LRQTHPRINAERQIARIVIGNLVEPARIDRQVRSAQEASRCQAFVRWPQGTTPSPSVFAKRTSSTISAAQEGLAIGPGHDTIHGVLFTRVSFAVDLALLQRPLQAVPLDWPR